MRIRVLGCHGGMAPGYQTSCYMINDTFLIDAGSVASSLSPERQMSLTDVVITHPHIDHIKDLCFLIENTFSPHREPLVLHSTSEILKDLHNHIFNDVIWPDFTKIPATSTSEKILLKLQPLDQNTELFGVKIYPVAVNHPGHAVGYILDDGDVQVLFTGDTGPTEEIWRRANKCPNLKAVFTEVSFPDRMDRLAKVSGHFTTSALIEELTKLNSDSIPVYIAHFKPYFFEELLEEFHRISPKRMILMHQDDEFLFT